MGLGRCSWLLFCPNISQATQTLLLNPDGGPAKLSWNPLLETLDSSGADDLSRTVGSMWDDGGHRPRVKLATCDAILGMENVVGGPSIL
jgi:hypothetical protein